MQQSPLKDFDIIAVVLGVLAFIALFALSFIHPPNPLLETPTIFLFGLLWLYQGTKKVRAARLNQRPIHWYTQPSILMGIATIISIPPFIINAFLSNSLRDIIIGILLLVPSLVLVVAAIYFYFRGLWRKYTFQ